MKNTRTATALALFTGIISMSLGGSIVCASTVTLGSLTPFTGGDAGEGLDLSGNIIYAFNLGGTDQTVQGVNFVAAPVGGAPAGIAPSGALEFNYSAANPGGANGADYGASADDDALESIVNSVWYNTNWTFDLDVVPGTQYRLQLIFQESWFGAQGMPNRNFDVSVGTVPLTLAIDELVLGQETNGANSAGADAGLVYAYTFTATDTFFQVALDDSPTGTDTNAILAAVILEELGDDTTPPSISSLDPVDDATGVPTNSDLVVTFDEGVGFGTGNITIKESMSDAVVEAFDVATSPNLLLSGASVTINPSSDLPGTNGYYVEIDPEAIDDTSGNSFAGITDSATWSFATAAADVTEPAVGTVDNPANGATDVSLDSSLALTFDEDVQKGAGNIVIRRADDDTEVDTIDVTTAAVTVNGAQITIVPTFPLPSKTSLYVEIDPGAFLDFAGNSFAGISGSGTWNFTTLSRVPLGTLTPFTGGDAGEGLDLSGNIIYAFNLGGTDQTVQGVNFAAAPGGAPPAGITTSGGPLDFDYNVTNGGNAADYGNSADDDALEDITTFIWYGSNWTFDLAVVPGTEYQLQLILQEGWINGQGTTIRNFDVSVETASPSILSLAIDDLVLGTETNGAFQPGADFGLVYTYTFTAADDSFRVALDDSPNGTDTLAVLTAVTLEELSEETLAFSVTGNGANLDFEWESKPGVFYVLWSSTDLAADLSTWESVNVPGSVENTAIFEIATNPPTNSHSIPRPGDSTRFYRVQEFLLPPVTVLTDDFESGQGAWTVGSDGAAGTEWQLGTPTNVGPAVANSGVSCFGTNLDGDYGLDADVWLRSPAIDLTGASAATLTYAQFIDIELSFDSGVVNVLDAADDSLIVEVASGIDGTSTQWDPVSRVLPAEALGKVIKIEFRLQSDNFSNQAGWYLDDVMVTTPAP